MSVAVNEACGGLAGILQFYASAEGRMIDSTSMAARMSRLESRQNGMARDVEVLKLAVKTLAQKLERLEQRMEARFDHSDQRVERVASSFDALRVRLERDAHLRPKCTARPECGADAV